MLVEHFKNPENCGGGSQGQRALVGVIDLSMRRAPISDMRSRLVFSYLWSKWQPPWWNYTRSEFFSDFAYLGFFQIFFFTHKRKQNSGKIRKTSISIFLTPLTKSIFSWSDVLCQLEFLLLPDPSWAWRVFVPGQILPTLRRRMLLICMLCSLRSYERSSWT